MLRFLEHRLTFKPSREDHGGLATLPHERLEFGGDCGMRLDGIFVDNGSSSVLLFTHGNRHNITKFREHYDLFTSIGQSFFTFDYPGYGKSAGVPSEDTIYASAKAAYRHLTQERGFSAKKVVSYGCSMGGAVAIELLQDAKVACLITECAFTNTREMARHLYPLLPVWPLLPKRFENDRKIAHIKAPILLIHGDLDPIVPARMASTLASAATSPTELIFVPGANHINSLEMGADNLRARIKEFIAKHTA